MQFTLLTQHRHKMKYNRNLFNLTCISEANLYMFVITAVNKDHNINCKMKRGGSDGRTS